MQNVSFSPVQKDRNNWKTIDVMPQIEEDKDPFFSTATKWVDKDTTS